MSCRVGGTGARREAMTPRDNRAGEIIGQQRMRAMLPRVGLMHCGVSKIGIGHGATHRIGRFGIA
jgi:hypothetical protein